MAIFLPEKIKVGYCERDDTFTGKLAYVIYYGPKGELRKERSWESWREEDIPAEDFANEPTSGFVLNKNVGGYSGGWDSRKAYCRVFDPRGFEFEIGIENLLFILENTDSIKGKGLVGEFVYGWDRSDLILIPVSCPDYIKLTKFSGLMKAGVSLKGKDMILGATYMSNKDQKLIYLGRSPYWEHVSDYSSPDGLDHSVKKANHYWFYDQDCSSRYCEAGELSAYGLVHMASMSKRIISCLDDAPVHNYAEIMDVLEQSVEYSPYDPSRDIYSPMLEITERTTSDVYLLLDGEHYPVYCQNYDYHDWKITLQDRGNNPKLRNFLNQFKQPKATRGYWGRNSRDEKIGEWKEGADCLAVCELYTKQKYLTNGKEWE